jgi:hypothetical protein
MRVLRRLVGGILVALALLGWGAGAAWAFWTSTGTGTGTASTSTLNPPTGVTTSYSTGASAVGLSWTASAGGVIPQGYVVRRLPDTGPAVVVCGSPSPPLDATSCTDDDVPTGTYTWTVTAVYNSWTASASSDTVIVNPDNTPPTVPAPTVPAQSTSTSVVVDLTDPSDTGGSGIDPSSIAVLRAEATFSDGTCGPFGTFVEVALSPGNTDTVTSGTCYRYRQRAADLAGNVATSASSGVLQVDTTPPAEPELAFSDMTNTFASDTALYYRATASTGGFTLNATATDAESGVSSYAYPTLGSGWAGGGTSGTYSWSVPNAGTDPGPFAVTAANGLGLASPASSFTVIPDTTGPTLPTPLVPAGPVTSASVTVGLGTASDDGAGVAAGSLVVERASAPLTSGSCGTFGSFAAVTLADGADTTVLDGTCYQYRQRALDNVGNEGLSDASVAVRVDSLPRIVSVALSNGGAAGTIGRGDRITVVFSETMRATSLCSAWTTGDTGTFEIAGRRAVTVTVVNGSNGANDHLAVTAAEGCDSTAGFGRLDLGSTAVVSGDVAFAGNGNNASTLSWDGSTNTLTIKVGAGSGVVSPAVAGIAYANPDIADPDGNKVANSPFTGATGGF